MAMIINEGADQPSRTKPPRGFPVCQNFYNDRSVDVSYVKKTGLFLKVTCLNFFPFSSSQFNEGLNDNRNSQYYEMTSFGVVKDRYFWGKSLIKDEVEKEI